MVAVVVMVVHAESYANGRSLIWMMAHVNCLRKESFQ
jgi:hypothetical protein